ncbi:lymphotactin-like [Rhinoderma darwinii]|uniref:lymphotactin-like n=1 Tax=Rhinoderma darwinii TaxID=43563 RepID=UPI003F67DF07
MKLSHIPFLTFIGVILSTIESQGLGFGYKDMYSCLEVQTAKVHIKILQSYTIKTTPIDAVLFSTKNGKMICADPNEVWVKKAIIALDKQAQNQSPKTGTSGSKKKVKKTATKTKKPAGKKTAAKQKKKKKAQPSKKAAPFKSIIEMLTTRTPAGTP